MERRLPIHVGGYVVLKKTGQIMRVHQIDRSDRTVLCEWTAFGENLSEWFPAKSLQSIEYTDDGDDGWAEYNEQFEDDSP